MPIDTSKVAMALNLIHEDDQGFFTSGRFIDLWANLHINHSNDQRLNNLNKHIDLISNGVWNMYTIALRLNWQKDLVVSKELNKYLWMYFAAADINMFHVTFRSTFDYTAKFINFLHVKPGQIPDTFDKLKNWAFKSESNTQKLGEDIIGLLQSCDWFNGLRSIRNSIVHNGGSTLVFPIEGRICFQVHDNYKNKILIPEIMFNENVVDFELYAGLFLSYLMVFLEDLSQITKNRINISAIGANAKSYHSGLQVTRNWMRDIISLHPI
jgi:hypothetical protein